MTGSHTDHKGFTLLELVVATGIFAIFMLVIVGMFSQFVFTQRRNIAEQALLEDVRTALEIFER